MGVCVFKSTDPGAPTISGTPGSFIATLEACLVTGYGSKTPPTGWTKPFSSGNVAVFRPTDAVSSKFYYRLDDAANYGGRVVGYESMTNVDTGTNAFPTEAQFAGGLYCKRSNATDSVARPWVIIADECAVYALVSSNNGYPNTAFPLFFGDIVSLASNHPYDAYISACNAAPSTTYPGAYSYLFQQTSTGTSAGCYIARSYTQTAGAVTGATALECAVSISGNSTFGTVGMTYPDPVTGSWYYTRALVSETTWRLRGYLPGLLVPMHASALTVGNTYTVDEYPGRTFLCVGGSSNALSTGGQELIDITGPWR